jgi:hypothetical protein
VFPRGVLAKLAGTEIKPVEPDQGNACAGKVQNIFRFPLFTAFPFILNLKFFKK